MNDQPALRRMTDVEFRSAERKELIRRRTAMTDAMVRAFEAAGIDTAGAILPVKTEPTWRVSRRDTQNKRGRR